MLLTVASEFIESTTNFSTRLARHRGSDSLDVKDFQLHLGKFHLKFIFTSVRGHALVHLGD